MRITERFKGLLRMAKDAGYVNVYSVLGSCMTTTYCHFYRIDELLEMPPGTSYTFMRHNNRWRGCANTRMVGNKDIGYTELFRTFGK
ncbi:MAG: hypothetical protein ABSH25_20230 [Syntrophorhabdales bacterium]|jgi:hypothetical protein